MLAIEINHSAIIKSRVKMLAEKCNRKNVLKVNDRTKFLRKKTPVYNDCFKLRWSAIEDKPIIQLIIFNNNSKTSSNNDVFLILKQSEGKGVYIYIFQNAKQCYQINHLKENIAK